MDYQPLLNLAKKWGDILIANAGKTNDIGIKKQWLTEQDIQIEKEFTEVISLYSGDHTIFAEEIHTEFTRADNVWVIDPISGTYNYIHGLPHYCIVLSHIKKGEVIFSFVYDPSTREMFVAQKGKGIFLNGTQVTVSKRTTDLSIMFDLYPEGIFSHADALSIYKILTSEGRIKTFGSFGLHYAYVACGRADIAVTFNKDVFPEFAGKLLVEEAGGLFFDLHGNDFSLDSRGVIATTRSISEKVLSSLATVQIGH